MTDVSVGDRTYSVERFSLFKIIEAGDIVQSVLDEIPDMNAKIEAFTRAYRESNRSSITRAVAELRYSPEQIARVSEEAWVAAGNVLEVPGEPGALDIIAHLFPTVWGVARGQVVRLLALVASKNSDLEKADLDGSLTQLLDDEAKRLRHADAGELLDLLAATGDVLEAQFEGRTDQLGKLAGLFGFRLGATNSPQTADQEVDAPDTTGTESKPESSTSSDAPTDGIEAKVSTGPQPASSPASVT